MGKLEDDQGMMMKFSLKKICVDEYLDRGKLWIHVYWLLTIHEWLVTLYYILYICIRKKFCVHLILPSHSFLALSYASIHIIIILSSLSSQFTGAIIILYLPCYALSVYFTLSHKHSLPSNCIPACLSFTHLVMG